MSQVKLNVVEKARGYAAMIDELGLTPKQVGERVGSSRSTVESLVGLLALSDEILGLLERGELGLRHGRALLRVKDLEVRAELAAKVVQEGWSAEALDDHVPGKVRKQAQDHDEIALQVVECAGTVAWATGMKAITPEALATRNELSIAAAREHLDEAVRLELMDKHALLVGHSELYTATDYGRKLARKHEAIGTYTYCSGLKKCRVSIGGARHLIACASVAAALERRYSDHRLIGELELRKEEREQKYPLISMDMPGQGWRRLHSPDLVVWPPAEPGEAPPLPVAVEVELSLKKKEELTAICRGLARARNIEATVYFAGDRKIEEKLLDIIENLRAEETIVVNPLSAIIDPLPGFPLTDD